MHYVDLVHISTFEDWRPIARRFLQQEVTPDAIHWQCGHECSLFASLAETTRDTSNLSSSADTCKQPPRVDPAFIQLAHYVACHRDPTRFDLLYRLLWRITHGEPSLLQNSTDKQVLKSRQWASQVSRDRHKMKAFVRFRKLELREVGCTDTQTLYIAWFEPEHYILSLTATFFRDRFYNMDWAIHTPSQSVQWIDKQLLFGQGCDRDNVPDHDRMEQAWKVYYASIFNPARLKMKAMQAEMPKKYWRNLPEAELIPRLASTAQHRTQDMLERPAHHQGRLGPHTRFDRALWIRQKED